LALLATVNDLDRTNGTHLSPYFTVPCQLDEQGNLPDPPPYYAVLSSKEEAQTAKEVNRDWQPRLALQDGERLRNATLTVAWQTSYDGQLDGNPNPGGGLRMFPDAAEPGGNPRQVVRVKATVGDLAPGEKRDGHMVYFKSFDVDDPSANTGPIDDEGQTQDNRGTPPEGNLNPGFAVTNAQGEATVDFTVTMKPGDNFRVAADLNNDTWLNGLKVKQNDPQALIYESDEVTPVPPGKRTDLLTVWRKLHVEVDSMAAQTYSGSSTELQPQVLTDDNVTFENNQFSSYGEVWELNPNTGQGQTFTPTAAQAHSLAIGEGDMTQVAQVGDPYRVRFAGFDGDDTLRGDVSDPDVGGLTQAMQKAYIAVEKLAAPASNSATAWHYHFGQTDSYAQQAVYMWDHCLTDRTKPDYWVSYIIALYECPWEYMEADNDPDSELCLTGATTTLAGHQQGEDEEHHLSFTLAETFRDEAAQWGWTGQQQTHARQYTVAHEVGVQFGLAENRDHDAQGVPTNLMWAAALAAGDPHDGDEAYRAQVPLQYKADDIDWLRDHTAGPSI